MYKCKLKIKQISLKTNTATTTIAEIVDAVFVTIVDVMFAAIVGAVFGMFVYMTIRLMI